jgi:hypothetical protein
LDQRVGNSTFSDFGQKVVRTLSSRLIVAGPGKKTDMYQVSSTLESSENRKLPPEKKTSSREENFLQRRSR